MEQNLKLAPLTHLVVVANYGGSIIVELTDNMMNHVEQNHLNCLSLKDVGRDHILEEHTCVAIPLRWENMWRDFIINQTQITGKDYVYVK